MWKSKELQQSWPEANKNFEHQQKEADSNLAALISEEQCIAILKKFNENFNRTLNFLQYKITKATEVKGFLGEYYHLLIRAAGEEIKPTGWNDGEKDVGGGENLNNNNFNQNYVVLKFFIKKLPEVSHAHEKNMIFKKESQLYNSVFLELEKYAPHPWCPKLYLSTHNLLVLQNLDNLGYQSLANRENLEENEIFPILQGLASMHASSIIYEFKSKKSIPDHYSDCLQEITVHPEIPWYTTGLKALIEIAKILPKYQSEEFKQFLNNELPLKLKSVFDMVNPSKRYRNVLCHRDTWGGNIFVNPQNPKLSAIFVDFQTCRYCPPAVDIVYTLLLNLTKMERLHKEKKYLAYYWQQLQTFLSKEIVESEWGINENDIMESYNDFQLLGHVYRFLAFTVLKVPQEFVTDDYKNVERSKKLLEYMKESEKFYQQMDECVDDVIEAVINVGGEK